MNNKIICIKVGNEDYPTNSYIICDKDNNAVIIDPGFDSDKIIDEIIKNNICVKYIILTHCHADHLSALHEIKEYTNANILIHENDLEGVYDDNKAYYTAQNIPFVNIKKDNIISVKDNDKIKCGNIILEVIHTPGHTNGSICLYEVNDNILFTGDTLFYDCYGRCDLVSGNIDDMKSSLEKVFNTFENVIIYPGHDEISNIDSAKRRVRLLLKIRG